MSHYCLYLLVFFFLLQTIFCILFYAFAIEPIDHVITMDWHQSKWLHCSQMRRQSVHKKTNFVLIRKRIM